MKRHLLIYILLTFFLNLNAQTPVAVIDFFANGMKEGEVKALTDRFRNELFDYKKFDIMERAYMEDILEEQGFQLSGCTSDECVIEAGRLIGVEQIIGGSISKVGKTYTVSARIISVESGKILKTGTFDYTGPVDGLLKEGMQYVAAKLAGKDPTQIKYGQLSVKTPQLNTEIYIDKELFGTTPLKKQKLQTDSYTISLRHKYYFPKDTVINLANKENKRLTIDLNPDRNSIETYINKYKKFRISFISASVTAFCVAGYNFYRAEQLYDEYPDSRYFATEKHQQIEERDRIWQIATGAGIILAMPALKYHFDIKKLNKLLTMDLQYHQQELSLSLRVKL